VKEKEKEGGEREGKRRKREGKGGWRRGEDETEILINEYNS